MSLAQMTSTPSEADAMTLSDETANAEGAVKNVD